MESIEIQSESQAQQCRTCTNCGKRKVVGCSPDNMRKTLMINADSTTVHLNSNGSLPASAKKDKKSIAHMVGIDHEPIPNTEALIDTCGQNIQNKCQGCARFRPTKVTISDGSKSENGRMKFSEVIVGGWCSIGEEGILKGTQRIYCDPKPKSVDTVNEFRSSCATCVFNTSVFNLGMLDHSSPISYDLNPWQMAQARKASGEDVPIVISEMRRQIGQVPWPINHRNPKWTAAWSGLSRFYGATIVPGGIEMGKRWDPLKGEMVEYEKAYTILTPGLGDHIRLEADNGDDRFGLITRVSSDTVVIQVAAPWYRLLGFHDRDRVSRRILPHVRCENCAGTAAIKRANGEVEACEHCSGPEPKPVPKTRTNEKFHGKRVEYPRSSRRTRRRLIDDPRIDPKCQSGCDATWGPCYYHAKAPTVQESVEWVMAAPNPDGDSPNAGQFRILRETVLTRPGAHDSVKEENPQRSLIIKRGEEIKVTDLAGNEPHPSVFFQQINNLWMNRARNATERKAVLHQFLVAMSKLEYSRGRRVNFSWTKPNAQDPWHPYCSLNDTDKYHDTWSYVPNDKGELKLHVSAGHPKGESEAETTIMVGGVPHVQSRGRLVRGIDFSQAWNDQFGTPRSDMSTAITIASPMGYVQVLNGARIRQNIMRDPMFAWGKWQERMEWERVTNPGERLQEEMLVNEALEQAGREKSRYRKIDFDAIEWRVTQLDVGLPAPVAFTFPTIKALQEYLDTPTFIEGSDQTTSVGYWATMRARVLGYDIGVHRARQNSDRDIPSVVRYLESPHSDDNTALQESSERYICDTCFDHKQKSYEPEEITDVSLACPEKDCDGHLILRTKAREHMEAIMRADGDQIRKLAPGYRRAPNDEMAGIADSRSWLQNTRLLSMGCANYEPKPSSWKPSRKK